jgi:GTP-binding protein LepA
MEHDLVIIPVINKIDLPAADIESAKEQIKRDLGLDPDKALLTSAKMGLGINSVFEAVVERIPPPKGRKDTPLTALIFDAFYDPFRGTVMAVRLFDGTVKAGDQILLMAKGAVYKVEEVGLFILTREPVKELSAGMVGYIIAGIKTVSDVAIGDTLTASEKPSPAPLSGFKQVKPVVFSSIYPIASDDYPSLVEALEKYKLNDAALIYQKDSSVALGLGFRCGFLGLLHLEIVQERLEREFDQSIVMTAPSVRYEFILKTGQDLFIDNPHDYPDPATIEESLEPYIKASILTPERYIGAVMKLGIDRRGVNSNISYATPPPAQKSFLIKQ